MSENNFENALAAIDNVPVGTIVAWAGPTNLVPQGWLICNGDQIYQNTFPALCAIIQDYWGPFDAASGLHTLPDLRAMFLRGVNGSRRDSYTDTENLQRTSNNNHSNDVGSLQHQEFAAHNHGIDDPGHTHTFRIPGDVGNSGAPGKQGLVEERTS